jgi:hypothetical protein
MDPNTAWDSMLMAYATKQWSEALEYTEALKGWLDGGGFPPHPTIGSCSGALTMQPDEHLSRAIAIATCDCIYRHCLIETSEPA